MRGAHPIARAPPPPRRPPRRRRRRRAYCLPNILQMEAVVVTRHGGPEVLEMQCLPVPQPEPDEILIGMLLDVHLCHAAITCTLACAAALPHCRTAAAHICKHAALCFRIQSVVSHASIIKLGRHLATLQSSMLPA